MKKFQGLVMFAYVGPVGVIGFFTSMIVATIIVQTCRATGRDAAWLYVLVDRVTRKLEDDDPNTLEACRVLMHASACTFWAYVVLAAFTL